MKNPTIRLLLLSLLFGRLVRLGRRVRLVLRTRSQLGVVRTMVVLRKAGAVGLGVGLRSSSSAKVGCLGPGCLGPGCLGPGGLGLGAGSGGLGRLISILGIFSAQVA